MLAESENEAENVREKAIKLWNKNTCMKRNKEYICMTTPCVCVFFFRLLRTLRSFEVQYFTEDFMLLKFACSRHSGYTT